MRISIRLKYWAPTFLLLIPWVLDASELAKSSAGYEEMSDVELAELYGKYSPGISRVAYFGLKMQSTWKTVEGVQVETGLTAHVFGNRTIYFEPVINIYNQVKNDHAVSFSSGAKELIAGANGLTQGALVAGDGNQGGNRLHIGVLSQLPDRPRLNGRQRGEFTVNSGEIEAGTVASKGGFGVFINIAGAGSLSQQLGRGGVGGGVGFNQSIILNSDGNAVANSASISVLPASITSSRNHHKDIVRYLSSMTGIR